MSTAEIYLNPVNDTEKAAEYMAARLRDSLRQYECGEEDRFSAVFPINLSGYDGNGRGVGVNDIAHDLFLDMIGISEIETDYIVYGDGKKLYFEELSYEMDGKTTAFQISYSTEAFIDAAS